MSNFTWIFFHPSPEKPSPIVISLCGRSGRRGSLSEAGNTPYPQPEAETGGYFPFKKYKEVAETCKLFYSGSVLDIPNSLTIPFCKLILKLLLNLCFLCRKTYAKI